MDPVKVKVYGLIRLTKRTYLTVQIGGFLVVLAVMVYVGLQPRPTPRQGEKLPPFAASLVVVLDHLPWIVLIVLLLAAIETLIVLHKFRKETERLKSLAELSSTPPAGSGAPPPPTNP